MLAYECATATRCIGAWVKTVVQEGALMLTWGITLTTVVAALGQMSVMPILSVICVMKDVPAPLPQQLS